MNVIVDRYRLIMGISLLLLIIVVVIFCVYRYGNKHFFYKKTKLNFTIPTTDIRKMVLDNGMTVLVFPIKSIPKVLVQIAYDIGSGVEESGERGMAHLVEHMIFKGTQRMSEGDIDEIARKYGASFNAETSHDVTSYYFETNKNNWKPFLDILADCMQNARFDEQHLASEMKVVIQELKMYNDDYWYKMLEKIDSLLYPANHPYHHPIIGYKEDLINLSSDRLKRFYEKYYKPNRATLFIIGDVDADEALKEAKKHFGPIPLKNPTSLPIYPTPSYDLATHNTHLYEDVKSEQLGFYWRTPGTSDATEILSTATALLLGGGEGSRLHRALVDEHQVAISVAVHAEKSFASGIFLIFIEPAEGAIEECRKVVLKELRKAIAEGFTEQELEHMTKMQGKQFLQRLQNFDALAQEWITSYFSTRDEYALFNKVNQFANLSSHHIQSFMKEYLDPFFMNQIQVLPVPEEKQPLIEFAKKKAHEFDEQILAKFLRTSPIENTRYVHTIATPKPLEFTFPQPDRSIKLANGLTILLKENRSLPLVSLQCKFKDYFYFSGSREGIIIELMMQALTEGSEGFSKQELINFFEFHGVDYEFGTSGGRLSCLNVDIKPIIKRFLHILTKPAFSVDTLEKLKTIAIDSFERDKDDAVEVAHRELKKLVYHEHPFSWDFNEAIKLLETTSLDDIRALHKELIVPSNMILSLVGDFNAHEMEALVREVFSPWSSGPTKHIDSSEGIFKPNQNYDIPMPRDQVVLLFGKPSELTIHHADLIPMKLLNYIGFYEGGSRLFKLREQTGLFYTAFGVWGAGASKEHGIDFIGALLNPEKTTFAEQEMRTLINELTQNGVTVEELDAARHLYLKSLIDAIATNSGVADLFCTLEAFNLGFDYYDKVLKRMGTITKAELDALCKKYFTMDDMVRIRVGRVK